jgi:peptidoglycan/xylan/chitin deacetylase (PgdA/CDA1 family)
VAAEALILTYHAVEPGPGPLRVHPSLFRAHLDCLGECGAEVLTISELAAALRAGAVPERAVALTFDDGCASVAQEAAPLLAERGLKATVFCVAGYLNGRNDWPSQHPGVPRLALMSAAELSELARTGFEIGSHGMEHAPLDRAVDGLVDREVEESRSALERAAGTPVRSFAYPYGARPSSRARARVERVYSAACTTTIDTVRPGADPFALPRIDAHYLRRPSLLRRAVVGSLGPYVRARRIGARARRVLVPDHPRAGRRAE